MGGLCDTLGEGNVGLAFGLTVLAGLSINVGAAAPFLPFVRRNNTEPLAAGLAFAAGVLIYIALTEVFKEAIEFFECTLHTELKAYFATIGCLVAGCLFTALLEVASHKLKDHDIKRTKAKEAAKDQEALNNNTAAVDDDQSMTKKSDHMVPGNVAVVEVEGAEGASKHVQGDADMLSGDLSTDEKMSLKHMSILQAVALGIHNFPEGVATFIAGLANERIGVALALAMILHSIPEGIGIAMPMYYATGNKWIAFPYTFVAGMMLPVSAGIAYAAFRNSASPALYGSLFGMASGMIIFICIHELLPAAFRHSKRKGLVTMCFMVGMVVMACFMGIGEGTEVEEEEEHDRR